MKTAIFLFLCLAIVLPAGGSEIPYQTMLMKIRDRYAALEAERSDPRRDPKQPYTVNEKERQQLLGQLYENDPVWVLLGELERAVLALVLQKSTAAGDAVLLDEQKSFLALAGGIQGQAKNREEATQLADTVRGFVVRRDIAGLKKWTIARP